MTLSPTERAFLAAHFPLIRAAARTEQEIDDLLDAWLAYDHIDDNHVYSWTDESNDQ